MEFEFTWVDPSLVVCRTSGLASVEGYEAMMRALTSQPQFRPSIDLIVDHTNVDISGLTAAEIERVADLRAQFAGAMIGRAAGVIGADSPLRYGLARMFAAHLDFKAGTAVRVFETLDEAMAWLQADDADPTP